MRFMLHEPYYQKIVELQEKNLELEQLFELQHKQMQEATHIWQRATGRFDTLPDVGQLLTWLLDERTALQKELNHCALSAHHLEDHPGPIYRCNYVRCAKAMEMLKVTN